VLIFNIWNTEPYWISVEVTPVHADSNFYIGEKNLIVTFNRDKYLQVTVENIDNRKTFSMQLPDDWSRGVGTFFDIVDSLTVKDAIISLYQKGDDGTISKTVTRRISLK
jgi:hypothetical protein